MDSSKEKIEKVMFKPTKAKCSTSTSAKTKVNQKMVRESTKFSESIYKQL